MNWIRRHPAATSGAIVFAILAAFFAWTGAITGREIPSYAGSRTEVIGMTLMLLLLPPYFVMTSIVVRRYSLGLLEQLRPSIPDDEDLLHARHAITDGWRAWPIGVAIGIGLASFNTSIFEAVAAPTARSVTIALSLGQSTIWIVIGVVLVMRFRVARAFRRLGRSVDFELFALGRLKPVARSALADVVVVAGALAFSPLQALDAEFRWYNFHFGIGLAILSIAVLLVWPLWPLHRRIHEAKTQRLAEIDARVFEATAPSTTEEIVRLESLLAHRDRIAMVGTWLISIDLVWRFVLYLVIPPLAWVAAAIVERGVDAALAQ